MLILLPPSEGKYAPRRGLPLDPARLSFPDLTDARTRVLRALTELCRGDADVAVETLGLGRTQRDLLALNAGLPAAPTARADRVYTGVLYDALDVGSLDPAARRRAGARLAITSSLFGLLRPADRIPAYRLSGATTLPGVGPVAALWRDDLGAAVREAAGDGLLVDLRSSSYAAFWRPGPELAGRVATVRVMHVVDGRRRTISHGNKATKGRIVRTLLQDGRRPGTPQALAALLDELGWTVEAGPGTGAGTRLDVVADG